MGHDRSASFAEMQAMNSKFTNQANSIRQIKQQLDTEAAKAGTPAWKTKGAQQFKQAWDEYKSNFDKIAQACDAAAKDINSQMQTLQQI